MSAFANKPVHSAAHWNRHSTFDTYMQVFHKVMRGITLVSSQFFNDYTTKCGIAGESEVELMHEINIHLLWKDQLISFMLYTWNQQKGNNNKTNSVALVLISALQIDDIYMLSTER
jgi:hypothetical protein